MTVLERKALYNPYGMTDAERESLAFEQAEQRRRSQRVVAQSWRENARNWLESQGCTVEIKDRKAIITGPTGKAVSATTNQQVYRFLVAAGWPGANHISEEGYCK